MEPVKDYKWLINSLLGAVLLIVAGYFGYTIVKDPVTPPSPTPGAQKVLYVGVDNPLLVADTALLSSYVLNAARNEVRGFFVKASDCSMLSVATIPGITVSSFKPVTIKTVNRSFNSAVIGDYIDPLIPLKEGECVQGLAWVDVAISAQLDPGTYSIKIGDLPITVKVNSLVMPVKPSIPMYVGLNGYALLAAHKLSPNTGVDVQGALIKKYADMLRAHRIEPYAHSPATPPIQNGRLNLDQWSEFNASFRQLVMEGAIAPTVIANFSDRITPEFLQAVNATIAAEPALAGAWYYVHDEPQTAADLADVVVKLKAARQYAPLVKTMVTHTPWTEAVGLLDYPTPGFQAFTVDSRFPAQFAYGSCSAHGSCANGYLGAPIGIPDLMIDEPTIHFRMFPLMGLALGVKSTLYYAAVEGFGKIDPWTNLYLFGGNGDGTLMFPGIAGERGFTENVPVSSLRLKLIRQGVYDTEYLRLLSPSAWKSAIPGATGWTKSHAAIEALRLQAAP